MSRSIPCATSPTVPRENKDIAIAAAAETAGANVTLICGPVNLPDPPGVKMIQVESAREMLRAVERTLPADVAIFAAAVADWRVANAGHQKMKKTSRARDPRARAGGKSGHPRDHRRDRKTQRPKLVIGFAAETENVVDNAKAKLARKGCDWIVANDVSPPTGVMGGDRNTITLVTRIQVSKHGRRKARTRSHLC